MIEDDPSDRQEAAQRPDGIDLSDFEAIEAAVSETVRGRWFLAEYARRLRGQDTGRILAALSRMEERQSVLAGTGFDGPQRVQSHGIAERLSDIAWALRERGLPDDLCRMIEREASAVAALGGGGVEQGAMLARDVTPAPSILAAAAIPPSPSPQTPLPQTWSFARLDALSADDKVRLFA